MSKERKYTDQEVADALFILDVDAAGNRSGKPNYSKVARATSIPRMTLADWWNKQQRINREVTALRHIKKTDFAERLDGLCQEILDSIDAPKLESATLSQLLTALGIAVDKARILRGEPTSINEHRGPLTDVQRLEGLAALHDRIRTRGEA